MASEYETIVQFIMIAGAVWLFVHLVFGIGTLREAILLSLLGAFIIPLMQGQGMPVFAAIFGMAGIAGMQLYKVERYAAIALVLTAVAISLFMFPFH
ncbi:MAG: hypothetical protein V1835_00165 [Candidatus Micrarchaeota archaeon]